MDKSNIQFRLPDFPHKPVLSLILCSRNDEYMGNSRWRLQTTLNYLAKQVHELDREADVEVLVTDWGSEIPLRQVLDLSSSAARVVSFIEVPPEMSRCLQKDSPFAEVLALNAAARRAGGEYIGRIDQDTLVGKNFFESFFKLYEGKQQLVVPLSLGLLFANQRMVPYRFSVRRPPEFAVGKFIEWFGRFLKIEITNERPFYQHGVGIWLVHRSIWDECGGYDERMIYMNAMEENMIVRLINKDYKVLNWGKLVGYDFYHIEHYHSLALRSSSTHRKVNITDSFFESALLNPNGPEWGLVRYPFEKLPYSPKSTRVTRTTLYSQLLNWLGFFFILLFSVVQIALDVLIKPFAMGYIVWMRRGRAVWETVHDKPFGRWPRLLTTLWTERKSIKR